MTAFSAVGSRFYVGEALDAWPGGSPPPLAASAFASVTWTEVGSVMSLGRLSGAWTTSAWADMSTNPYLQVWKRARPNKQMVVSVAADGADTGQVAMFAAEDDQERVYPFKIELPTGEVRQFIGRVIAAEEALDDGSAPAGTDFTIVLLSNVARS